MGSLPQSIIIKGSVGAQSAGSGLTSPAFRQLYTGEMAVADVHGRYQEAMIQGGVFTVTYAAAALAAASATAAGAFVLLNPTGSGYVISILNITTYLEALSAVATGTSIVVGALINPVFSALGTAVAPTNNLVGSSKLCPSGLAGYPSGTYAVLPSVTPPGIRTVGAHYIDLQANSFNACLIDDVAGAVGIQPGNGINLFGLGGTAADLTIGASITFELVPVNAIAT